MIHVHLETRILSHQLSQLLHISTLHSGQHDAHPKKKPGRRRKLTETEASEEIKIDEGLAWTPWQPLGAMSPIYLQNIQIPKCGRYTHSHHDHHTIGFPVQPPTRWWWFY